MKDDGSKSLLAQAIERKDWEIAALCLLLGAVEAANKLPRETLDALLDELGLDLEPSGRARHGGRRGRGRRGSHGPA